MYITQDELDMLESVKNEKDWNHACDAIKLAHGSYPVDWFTKVNRSGLMAKVAANWNKPDAFELKISRLT